MTTIRELLDHATRKLSQSDSARLDAQVLLEHVLGVNRAFLLAHGEDHISAEHKQQFDQLIDRRSQGEPIAYILGVRGFYDLEFRVTPDVLIPRPETELLLEKALELMQDKPEATVADIGTGSGALAVTFARHMPSARVYATDISPDALTVARSNANRNQVEVTFFEGNLARPLMTQSIKVDLLMANLPYIRHDEMSELAVSQYEPHLALDGGDDGLDLIRELFTQLPDVCQPHAYVLLEIGAEQGQALQTLTQVSLGVSCQIFKDYAGLDRFGCLQL